MALLDSQVAALLNGINGFEPYIYKLHSDYDHGHVIDWPAVFLATTLQATAISLIKLLPSKPRLQKTSSLLSNINKLIAPWSKSPPQGEVLDRRSIATVVRNFIDTYDVLDMMNNASNDLEHDLNRNILGLYITSRIEKVRTSIDTANKDDFYNHSSKWYWDNIRSSPLYNKSLDRLKGGENIFYQSRRVRVAKICGEDTDFVIGVLADLSTYVHSIPPALWLSGLDNLYSDTEQSRDVISVWVRIANFYFAQSIKIIANACNLDLSDRLNGFLDYHETVFSPSEN